MNTKHIDAKGSQGVPLLIPIMVVAAWVRFPHEWRHTSPGGVREYPGFLITASLAAWLSGEGALTMRRSNFLTLST